METQRTRPRFRTDLVAKPVEENGQVFVDVTDPDTGSTFRFYEVEYSVACAMDGARDVTDLASWAQQELGLEPSREELSTVVATLGELGYLEAAGPGKNPALAKTLAAGTDAEASFAGLLDIDVDDDAKTHPAVRMPRRNRRPDSEEDTQIPPPRSPVADDDLPRLSTDLSEHVPIGTQDVKDAVRRSRVHVAVVPPMEPAKKATPAAVPATPDPVPHTPTPVPPASPSVTPASLAPPRMAPATAAAVASAETEDKKGGGWLMVAFVVVLIVALGLTVVYYYLNYMRTDETAAVEGDPSAVPTSAEPAAAENEPPTTSLQQGQPVPVPVVAEIEGKVAWVADDAATVAAGDPLIRLEGYKESAKDLAEYQARLEHYQGMLDHATATGDKAKMAHAGKKVEQKHQLIAESKAKLAKLTIAAPAAGEAEPKVAVGDTIKNGDQVAALIGAPGTRGTFTVLPGAFYEEGTEVTVSSVASPDQTASCKVAAVVSNAVTVRCPADSPFSPGDQVTLK